MKIWEMMIWSSMEGFSLVLLIAGMDERLRKNFFKMFLLVGATTIFGSLSGYYELPFRMVWGIVMMVVLLKVLVHIPVTHSVFLYLTSTLMVMSMQIVEMVIMVGLDNTEYTFINGVIVNGINMVLSILIYKFVPTGKLMNLYLKRQSLVNGLLLMVIVPVLLYGVLWDSDKTSGWQYMAGVLAFVIIWSLVVVIVFFEFLKLQENKKLKKIYEEYNPILENLIEEVRSKQHDYKNHLQMLYSMAEVGQGDNITAYIDDLLKVGGGKERYLKVSNAVVGALLYSKSAQMESLGVDFEFAASQDLPIYPFKDYEMVEVLGNLIDNARDAALQTPHEDKKVTVKMAVDQDKKIIQVTNTGIPITGEQISKMFHKGFSTKGKNRGYGLYNVKKIVDGYCGSIHIDRAAEGTQITLMFS